MYNIAVCDDDRAFAEAFRERLTAALGRRDAECAVTLFSDPDELSRSVEEGAWYQLLFLDVMFSDTEQGLRLAASLRRAGCGADIVFMSSSPDFAADSFDMFIIVQTQFHISLNNRELEFHGFEPLTVRLPVLKNLYL